MEESEGERSRFRELHPANPAEKGVALVITLIFLAIITTLAIAFLALSHRETAAVTATTATVDAELAADTGMERAKAQVLGYLRTVDRFGPDLMVSVNRDTNRIHDPANNKYLTNIHVDASVPVFVSTNRDAARPLDERFYLDLNRNQYFEETGTQVPFTTDVKDANGLFQEESPPRTGYMVGDPQWIGVLQYPNRPHGIDNRFIARYAFMVLPAGKSLDINWIHNQVRFPNANLSDGPTGGPMGYFRNQGVGTWELNLAGFLTDLNPNYWGTYQFDSLFADRNTVVPTASGGAFSDAREFLAFRYPDGASRLYRSTYLSNDVAAVQFGNNFVDDYGNGPIPTNVFGSIRGLNDPVYSSTAESGVYDDAPFPNVSGAGWHGANSGQHFFTLHDFFNPNKLRAANGFIRQMSDASARGSSSNRYTFYRMLDQLATDSAPEEDKINLNCVNVGGISATNMIPWTSQYNPLEAPNTRFRDQTGRPVSGPALFFNSASSVLLSNEFSRITNSSGTIVSTGISNVWSVPVFTNTAGGGIFLYSPRVHQLLQLTANIYEATASQKNAERYPYYPTVFRPTFRKTNDQLCLDGYIEVTSDSFRNDIITGAMTWLDPKEAFDLAPSDGGRLDTKYNVYDVPILFGARAGTPNFNELTVMNHAQFSRKLEFRKNSSGRITDMLQLFVVGVSNVYFAEAWNSLSTNRVPGLYPNELELWVTNVVGSRVQDGFGIGNNRTNRSGFYKLISANSWTNGTFIVSDMRGGMPLVESIVTPTGLIPYTTNDSSYFQAINPARGSNWVLSLQNKFAFFLFDRASGRLVDAVASSRMTNFFDISRAMTQGNRDGREYWLTERKNQVYSTWPQLTRTSPLAEGLFNQINASTLPNSPDWKAFAGTYSKASQVAAFTNFWRDDLSKTNLLVMQSPFNPTTWRVQVASWQANDPIVHQNAFDLYPSIDVPNQDNRVRFNPDDFTRISPSSISNANWKYNPWGGRTATIASEAAMNRKDPSITNAAAWDFMSDSEPQKFPNIGWLGRVHRGTPWQTIYLKSQDISDGDWQSHVGPAAATRLTHPTNDWRLLDLFTTAVHPNATRGQLSINQTNPAAWSAVFSGIVATEASVSGGRLRLVDTNVVPASVDTSINPPLVEQWVEAINAARASMPGGKFQRLGDLLATRKLTVDSPLITTALNSLNTSAPDSVYERVPQQIMSLVRLGEPRYVIYAWGQSLKPAERGVEIRNGKPYPDGTSIVTAGPERGLVRNYQITGETATRAVLRIDYPMLPNGLPDYARPRAVVESFNAIPIE